ncbi:SPOSA6832_02308 [Sporobolomyces salmonicolor]|uniref:SPOSA6832_02308-mRNA-1:cds n=1 Tax=Sporidiobolus salmonicolor TaxID=5005 RepID=A0A0D6EKZ0_SPOSA|nr:SPOSA6832_02308 [Sporobolomyces salmonicolor]
MSLPPGAQPPLPTHSVSLNGTAEEALERFKIRELMEGFPAHRDACEWSKLRALFAQEEAYVFTTWSGGVPIDEFIKISEAGFGKGVKIAHRVNGGTVDLATSGPAAGKRALGKLKACGFLSSGSLRKACPLNPSTITQRFVMPAEGGGDCEVDVDADCRLCFFVEKKADGSWKNHFFKGFYEKDRAHPVDPRKIPKYDDAKLASFPDGYRYLAYGQSAAYTIKLDLPQGRGVSFDVSLPVRLLNPEPGGSITSDNWQNGALTCLAGCFAGEEHDHFYRCFIDWLDGASIDEMKVKLGA